MNGEQKLYFTTKAGSIFCLFDQWSSEISMDLLNSETVKDISLLGWDGEITWKTEGEKLIIELPKMGLDEIPCLYAWTRQIELI
jgi:alpha-L-fucosidase